MGKPTKEPLDAIAAAGVLGVSLPYARMLMEQGQIPGALRAEDGVLRAPAPAVRAWAKANRPRGSADYRQAAREAGMYEIPEGEYAQACRGARGR